MSFPVGSNGKESACSAGDPGSILGWEDLLEKVRATHSSIPGLSLMPQMAKNLYSSYQFTR